MSIHELAVIIVLSSTTARKGISQCCSV